MSMHRLSGCPSCAEPLEEGDRFCGLCGYALTTTAAAEAGAPERAPAHAAPASPAGSAPAAPPAPPAAPPGSPLGSPAGGIPAARGLPAPGEDFASRHSGGHAEPAAPGYAGEAAPGWGSVSTAAPTLVSGPEGWSDPGHGAPQVPEGPYAASAQGRHPADSTSHGAGAAAYDSSGAAVYDGSDAYGTPGPGEHATSYDLPAPQGPHPGGEARYGDPAGGHDPDRQGTGPGHGAPYGGPSSPGYASGGEAPYGSAPQEQHPEGTPPYGSPAQQGQHAGEPPYGATAPQGQHPGGEVPYGDPVQQGHATGGEAPHAGQAPAPQGDSGGKTCVACRAGRVDTDGYCEHCGHAQPRERDHLEEELGSVAAVSDRGLRHHRNEDSFAVAATALPDGSAATVAIVCDGVSSASRPDEASAAAAGAANEALLEALPRGTHPQEAMHEAILAAATAVNALAPEVPGAQNAPACTLVGAVVSRGLLTIGWVGDSRAYWVPDDRAALPRRLTEDDSWAAQMVAAGLMGEAEAYADVRAHAITGWLGADAYDLEPHTATFKPDHDGVVVVCTDGLWNYAESARDMAQVLPHDAAVRPLHSAQVLVGHALDGGGHDNVTVAIVPFAATPPDPQTPPAGAAGAAGPAAPQSRA
ncbi:protein phosphatase 2C domain-containing protein [Streptomyces sp. NBC_01298]|uniref:protein phosphatase 2C domain-containing protein n=1 Tax=Streptomyces sp. NBC_01298 TaxID=2903817 RepID=UPI002E11DD5F|nr:protein phosphatase 2C domain-containing protein [Streptomyces sp. NBC_01298]